MSHRTSAQVVCDSITPYGPNTRLTSMYVVFPKMILGERNRHRGFSLSDRSSRAVPPEKLIAEVREYPAMPAKFRRRSKGMGGGEELSHSELVRSEAQWRQAAFQAADMAELMALDLSKEITNRPLDPYIRMHSLMTATRDVWLNFFGLRLDAAADPTIQVLAQRSFEVYKASTPKLLQSDEWHLPFIEHQEGPHGSQPEFTNIELAKKVSAARCAHLSYNDLETGKRMTVERALAIYDKLVGSQPIHASPLEHQATPDRYEFDTPNLIGTGPEGWQFPHQHGNLHGWRQFRKMISGEAVAPFPEGYGL